MTELETTQRRRFDVLGVAMILGLLAIIAAAYFAFPLLFHTMQNQDCIATGRVNCQ